MEDLLWACVGKAAVNEIVTFPSLGDSGVRKSYKMILTLLEVVPLVEWVTEACRQILYDTHKVLFDTMKTSVSLLYICIFIYP